jgi:hypothetical protein
MYLPSTRLVAPAAGEDGLLGLLAEAGARGVGQDGLLDRRGQGPLPFLAALAGVAVEAALQVQVLPAQVQDLAAAPTGEQVGKDQCAQAQAGRRVTRNDRQKPGHLLGTEAPGAGVGLPPRRPNSLSGVVGAQAFSVGPAVEATQSRQLGGLRRGREPAFVVSPPASPVSGQELLELRAIRLEGIQPQAEQALQSVQVGAGGALAGGELEVAGEVGQGQFATIGL